ncbi:hypothetical protein 2 [Wenzhou tombus-like virus 4]|uniref:hypothetical protein 2 n=1 Tax=Wenzhou tombus-like virus 4 TaxID=1923674 RepID=UPI00090B8D96|nr:hypothetical protein 2 [Wenzhou tombus-like virus 4]APG76362.1 hypothetical protein 2 [Wenzhou tombus-like virus 4]
MNTTNYAGLSDLLTAGSRSIAYSKLLSAEAAGQLEPGAASYIISALDPFHDKQYDATDVPSVGVQRSIVRVLRTRTRISMESATSVGYTQPGRLALCMYPSVNSRYMSKKDIVNGQAVDPATAAAKYVGGLVWELDIQGQPKFFTGDPSDYSADANNGRMSIADVTGGMPDHAHMRVIGCGFEVHNVTEELSKGGTVSVWQLPGIFARNKVVDGTQVVTNAPATGIYYNCDFLGRAPTTADEVTNIPTGQTWEAGQGCLVVPRLDSGDFLLAGCNTPNAEALIEGVWDGNGTYAYFPTGSNTSVRTFSTPFSMGGALFEGLPPESVLDVECKWIVAEVPHVSDIGDLVIARNTPPGMFPHTTKLIACLNRTLRDGYPAGWNESGKYWSSVLRAISSVLPMIGNAVPIPGAKLLTSAASAALQQKARNRDETIDLMKDLKSARPGTKEYNELYRQAMANAGPIQRRQLRRLRRADERTVKGFTMVSPSTGSKTKLPTSSIAVVKRR